MAEFVKEPVRAIVFNLGWLPGGDHSVTTRWETTRTAVASALRFYGFVSWCECAVMIYTVFMALVGEIINTAIEKTVDRISTEYNELSGRAKDIGSAIVFVSFFGAGIAWFVILLGVAAHWWSGHLLP